MAKSLLTKSLRIHRGERMIAIRKAGKAVKGPNDVLTKHAGNLMTAKTTKPPSGSGSFTPYSWLTSVST
jgi:hypothetical protein